MNIYDQQRSNQRKTWIILIFFILFFLFLGYGLDYFYYGFDPATLLTGSPQVPFATIFALGISGFTSWLGFSSGDKAVLAASHAVPGNPDDIRERQAQNIVAEMAIAAGLPPPALYIVPDPDPNAFATGTDPRHSSIAVTQGLLAALNREELQGVIAHEMSHIRNYDTRMMTFVAALVGGIVLLSDWARRGMRFMGGRGRGRSKGPAPVILLAIWILAAILAPVLAQVLAMAVSRRREYLADASGAELTRNPMALAEALKKIEFASAPTEAISRGTAHLCIADPLGRKMGLKEGFWADLLSTHPPMVKRINALREMAFQKTPHGQDAHGNDRTRSEAPAV